MSHCLFERQINSFTHTDKHQTKKKLQELNLRRSKKKCRNNVTVISFCLLSSLLSLFRKLLSSRHELKYRNCRNYPVTDTNLNKSLRPIHRQVRRLRQVPNCCNSGRNERTGECSFDCLKCTLPFRYTLHPNNLRKLDIHPGERIESSWLYSGMPLD